MVNYLAKIHESLYYYKEYFKDFCIIIGTGSFKNKKRAKNSTFKETGTIIINCLYDYYFRS